MRKTVNLGTATAMQAVFNNGAGTWDNNNGNNYRLGAGYSTVQGRRGHRQRGRPVRAAPPDTTAPTVPAA